MKQKKKHLYCLYTCIYLDPNQIDSNLIFYLIKWFTNNQLFLVSLFPPKTNRKTYIQRSHVMPPFWRYIKHFTCNNNTYYTLTN